MGERGNESWPDKGLWEYPKFFIGIFFSSLAGSGLAGLVILMVIWQVYGSWLLLGAGFVAGAFVIWRVVRWMNRHDDTRVNDPTPNLDAPSEST